MMHTMIWPRQVQFAHKRIVAATILSFTFVSVIYRMLVRKLEARMPNFSVTDWILIGGFLLTVGALERVREVLVEIRDATESVKHNTMPDLSPSDVDAWPPH